MKSKAMISAFIAVSLITSAPAFAQHYDQDHDRGHNGPPAGYGHPSPSAHYDNHANDRGRGAGPRHDFYRGRPLPREYRNHNYAVNDWNSHRLHKPPRGYQWFQTGADYVLVAVATGIIAEVVLGR
jgi:Ni/Co efflux regulator RcnB